jgi:hypothetical protein
MKIHQYIIPLSPDIFDKTMRHHSLIVFLENLYWGTVLNRERNVFWVYVTTPKNMISGYFEPIKIVRAPPGRFWGKLRSRTGYNTSAKRVLSL